MYKLLFRTTAVVCGVLGVVGFTLREVITLSDVEQGELQGMGIAFLSIAIMMGVIYGMAQRYQKRTNINEGEA